MRKTSVYVVGLGSYKLFTNTPAYPQVVFTTTLLGTNPLVTPSLCDQTTQPCTQWFYGFNSLTSRLVPTMHRPNNDYNKGE